MKENIKHWLLCVGIRAIHTMAQTAIATIGTSAKFLNDVNWMMVLSSSLLAGVLSILKSMAMGVPEAELTIDIDEEE